MSRVFIGIGSNQGDRLQAISMAVRALGAVRDVRIVQMATVIETDPIGPPQGRYLNTAVELETTRAPDELLAACKAIERSLGRTPSPQRWTPRVIDLDLLLYGAQVIDEPELRVPHPRLHERAFVLEPLAQLAPDVIHPVLRQPISALRDSVAAPKPCT